MCLRRNVFAHATSIYDIEISFFKKNNVKTLLIDLDNTLDSYKLFKPTERAVNYIKKIKEAEIRTIIVSNNKGKRVSSYANALNIEFIHSCRKPFARRINNFIREKCIDKSTTIMIGDQLVTDAGAANRAEIRFILTEKVVKEDQWTTHINRIFDKPNRKKMAKKGKLIDWRNV